MNPRILFFPFLLVVCATAQAPAQDSLIVTEGDAWLEPSSEGVPAPGVDEDALKDALDRPIRIFDNLYYVGTGIVAAWLVITDEGYVLINAPGRQHTEALLARMRRRDLAPGEIRYLFISHAHPEHCGGAARIREVSGARVGMALEDWDLFHDESRGLGRPQGYPDMPTDLVIGEGQTITLGGTTFTFYKTPGHTPGVLSLSFPVRDGAREYKAFIYGGLGLDIDGSDVCRQYIASLDRILAMDDVEVNLPIHPSFSLIFDPAEFLPCRQPGEPHPFVSPEKFRRSFEEHREKAVMRLESELRREAKERERTGRR